MKNCLPILLLQTIATLISTRRIIVLLSGNGMKFYFPLLNFAGKVFRTRVYHDVIGGNLDVYIKQNPKFVKYLNNFSVNWVETNQLKKCVESCGVKNCEVIPNFKRLAVLPESAIDTKEKMPFRFCTFSRVMKEKGRENICVDKGGTRPRRDSTELRGQDAQGRRSCQRNRGKQAIRPHGRYIPLGKHTHVRYVRPHGIP